MRSMIYGLLVPAGSHLFGGRVLHGYLRWRRHLPSSCLGAGSVLSGAAFMGSWGPRWAMEIQMGCWNLAETPNLEQEQIDPMSNIGRSMQEFVSRMPAFKDIVWQLQPGPVRSHNTAKIIQDPNQMESIMPLFQYLKKHILLAIWIHMVTCDLTLLGGVLVRGRTNLRQSTRFQCDAGPGASGSFWVGRKWYGYGSIPINTIFRGMNIHKSQLFWCELQGYKVLTHCHMKLSC